MMDERYTLEIVPFKGRWAIKAEMHGEVRYRPFYYKAEAKLHLLEWEGMAATFFKREFYHNFYLREELER